MKAIILAAGEGTRLGKYTKDLPKCMLKFNGKTLIERQVEVLRNSRINDITIVKGYKADKLQIQGVKYYINEDYANTNMVATLFCAEKEMNDDTLVCYGDILYEKRVLETIKNSNVDIGVIADEDYLDYWKARLGKKYIEDMESLEINEEGKIIELGSPNPSPEKAKVRYVGLIKFSKKGIKILKKLFYENKKKYWGKEEPWLNSKSFKKAYMTDMLQAIINSGAKAHTIKIRRGWMEFDTNEDYENAIKWAKTGEIKKFINIGL